MSNPITNPATSKITKAVKPTKITKPIDVTSGPARTVVVDPPWDINQVGSLGAINHYELMTLDRIKGMAEAIKAITAEDGHLYLWVTNSTIDVGHDVVRAWGYTPRSVVTWVKPYFRLGQYFRNATEHVIFATKGKAPVLFKKQSSWFYAPLQEHSRKPEEFFAIVERMSAGPYLELFARRRPSSSRTWRVWGNEIESDISLAKWGYPVPSDNKFSGQKPTDIPAIDGTASDAATENE